MSYVLEGPVTHRGTLIAAICRQEVRSLRTGRGLGVTARREPVALLIRAGGAALLAFRPDGTPLAPGEALRLCPEAAAAFAASAERS